jgi:hypothetical protein
MVDRGTFTNIMHNLDFVDERVRSHAPIDNMTPMPERWQPDNWSVICGRGRECFEHYGNRRFRILVDMDLENYAQAKSKLDKSVIVMKILYTVRDASNQGGFVKQHPETQRWFEVGDEVAREKIGQQFRIALAAKKKSATLETATNESCDSDGSNSCSTSKKKGRPSKSKSAIALSTNASNLT